ncbi:hypothetical protein D9M71_597030 [compost metagenome]
MAGYVDQVRPIIAAHAAGVRHASLHQHRRGLRVPIAGRRAEAFGADVQVFPEHFTGQLHDVLLLFQRQGVEGFVFVAVISHLMPALDNRLALFRPVLHDPGRDEERRRKAELVQQVEQSWQRPVRTVATKTEILGFVPDRAVEHGIAGRAVEVEGQGQAGLVLVGPGGLG